MENYSFKNREIMREGREPAELWESSIMGRGEWVRHRREPTGRGGEP